MIEYLQEISATLATSRRWWWMLADRLTAVRVEGGKDVEKSKAGEEPALISGSWRTTPALTW